MPKVFIQIGTNNGNDRFRQLVIENKPDKVVLIEPNPNLYETIRQNYRGIPNVTILPRAVYYEDDKDVDLFIGSRPEQYGKENDNGIVYTDAHFSLVPMNSWGDKDKMMKITAKSITFNTVCQMVGVTEIEYLQIDTEGFDSEIIRMLDFSKYTIQTIRYERWEFDSRDFTKHNLDTYENMGKTGMIIAKQKLLDNNYVLDHIYDWDGCDIIATLKTNLG
jgi:FkbM family methyltransferase